MKSCGHCRSLVCIVCIEGKQTESVNNKHIWLNQTKAWKWQAQDMFSSSVTESATQSPGGADEKCVWFLHLTFVFVSSDCLVQCIGWLQLSLRYGLGLSESQGSAENKERSRQSVSPSASVPGVYCISPDTRWQETASFQNRCANMCGHVFFSLRKQLWT